MCRRGGCDNATCDKNSHYRAIPQCSGKIQTPVRSPLYQMQFYSIIIEITVLVINMFQKY